MIWPEPSPRRHNFFCDILNLTRKTVLDGKLLIVSLENDGKLVRIMFIRHVLEGWHLHYYYSIMIMYRVLKHLI
ncbi:MAG TPA: hypothetical protein DCD97_01225 [Firmicutes bacterium]|nr:hypothetical protein [Bacillota bacterium]